jgi:hypothetical protein
MPASLTLAEEAAHTGCTQADLLAWRGLRIAVAHLDEVGGPKCRAQANGHLNAVRYRPLYCLPVAESRPWQL